MENVPISQQETQAEEPKARKLREDAKLWRTLREEWLLSPLSPHDFLRERGKDPRKGSVRRMIDLWLSDCPDHKKIVKQPTRKGLYAQILEAVAEQKKEALPTVTEIWDIYMRWRQTQSSADYLTAGKIREHLRLLLDAGLTEDGSKYTPSELGRLAAVAESIQRIQRLALGMSTENVGMEYPGSNVEKTTTEAPTTVEAESTEAPAQAPAEAPMPVFVVEMSRQGKFMRARPRMQLAPVGTS